MAVERFHPANSDYKVYHRLLEISEGQPQSIEVSSTAIAQQISLTPAQVDQSIRRLEEHGYISILSHWERK